MVIFYEHGGEINSGLVAGIVQFSHVLGWVGCILRTWGLDRFPFGRWHGPIMPHGRLGWFYSTNMGVELIPVWQPAWSDLYNVVDWFGSILRTWGWNTFQFGSWHGPIYITW